MDVLPLTCRAPHAPTTSFKAGCCNLHNALKSTKTKRRWCSSAAGFIGFPVKATAERSRETVDGGPERDISSIGGAGRTGGFTGSAMEVTTFNQSFGDASDFPAWEKIGALVRLSYGVGSSSFTSSLLLFSRFDFGPPLLY